tara:strand:- start:326 stop:523 length:198 start_codon:yes stop_codon:yes gene_type:complete
MNTESITQTAQNIAVHREVESARLMEFKEFEDTYRVKQIDNAEEFNALMNAEVMLNQGSFFDLLV